MAILLQMVIFVVIAIIWNDIKTIFPYLRSTIPAALQWEVEAEEKPGGQHVAQDLARMQHLLI